MKLESIHVKTFNLTKIILPRIRYNPVAVQAIENSDIIREDLKDQIYSQILSKNSSQLFLVVKINIVKS